MFSKKIEWEEPACNLCDKNKQIVLLSGVRYWENKYSFNIAKCLNCDLAFLSPRPEKRFIGLFYKSESYWGSDLNNLNDIDPDRQKIFGPIYKAVSRGSRIFDIGAGTGQFLSKYKEEGWEVSGVEYSRDAASFAKKNYGVNLLVGDFLDHKFKNKYYDYVVLNNVLEHLYKPLETLKGINKTLRGQGKLIICVPNINSLGFKLFKKNWYPLQPPMHLYYFDQNTLQRMLSESGFRVKTINYSYYLYNYFAIFESFRSSLTSRNYAPNKTKIIFEKKETKPGNKITSLFFKKLVVICIKFLSFAFAKIGTILGRGEYILLVATKT